MRWIFGQRGAPGRALTPASCGRVRASGPRTVELTRGVAAAWAAVVVLALAAAVLRAAGGGPSGSGWLARALLSPAMLVCAAVLMAGAGLMLMALAALWRVGRANRSARGGRGGQDGQAIIEFALALPFLLMLALLMTQTALLMVGNICVNYSAFCAARSAVVTVPQDFGAAEPRNQVIASASGGGGGVADKMGRIKQAAVYAVMPVSYGGDQIGGDYQVLQEGLSAFFGDHPQTAVPTEIQQRPDVPGWVDERLARKLKYAADHTQVWLSPPARDDTHGAHENLTVRVKHEFYLAVPYAARIFAAFPGGLRLSFGQGEYATEITASCTLPNEGVQDYIDVEQFPPPADN